MDENVKRKILEIKNLHVEYRSDFGTTHAVNGLDLSIEEGEAMGLVGESGSGKTTTALSVLRLLPKEVGKQTDGEIYYDGTLLSDLSEKKMRNLRGNKISMIFQNPLTSLNSVFTIGEQIAMVYQKHSHMGRKEAYEKAGEILEKVGIPKTRLFEYPHQFSGGMRQRVGIAAGLACNPDLLIADEPTTALDVTIQLQILQLLKNLQAEYRTSLLMITHNLGIVAELCSKVSVMYAGEIVESGPVKQVFQAPKHPYTIGLLNALPKASGGCNRLAAIEGSAIGANNLERGCRFHPRCEHCMEICKCSTPPVVEIEDGHKVRCHLLAGRGDTDAE